MLVYQRVAVIFFRVSCQFTVILWVFCLKPKELPNSEIYLKVTLMRRSETSDIFLFIKWDWKMFGFYIFLVGIRRFQVFSYIYLQYVMLLIIFTKTLCGFAHRP